MRQERNADKMIMGKQRKRQRSSSRLASSVFVVANFCLWNPTGAFTVNRSMPSPLMGFSDSRRTWTCFATPQSTNNKPSKKTKGSNQKNRNPKKTSVDDLVAKMGLQPVPKKKVKIQQKAKTTSNNNSHNSIERKRPSLQTQLDYTRNGHAVLRKYLDPDQLPPIREELLALGQAQELQAWRQKVQVAAGSDTVPDNSLKTIEDCRKALDRLGVPSDRLPFLQYFNTWRTLESVQTLAQELAETAAILLDVPSVRLYQDSFFWKRAQDGPTPWHVDARMAPFDTPSLLTLWIPLHDIPREGGSALEFVSKSHADFALPFWNTYTDADGSPWNRLEERYQHHPIVDYMPLRMGDLTVHSGWTLHCAGGQDEAPGDRLALAISYVDTRAPVRANFLSDHGDDEDQWSYADWIHEVPAGPQQELFDHPLVPIVWPPPKRD